MYVPQKMFLTKGIGIHKEKLASLEQALRNARIAPFNLVKVSSIIPPGCKIISVEEGLKSLKKGQIVFCVLSENSSREPFRRIAASVGLAIPQKTASVHGYLSEHHSFGQTQEEAGYYAEDLAAYMLATTLGIDFDPEASYDEKKNVWKIKGYEVETSHISQEAVCEKGDVWTTVIAAAVFV